MKQNKASKVKITAKILSSNYENTIIVDNSFCCRQASKHFVEGIAFEQSRLKEHYYVWTVTSPLWTRLPHVKLNYSNRLNNGLTLTGDLETIVKCVMKSIEENESIKRFIAGPEMSPQDFISIVNKINPIQIDEFDYGIALALAGEFEKSIYWLRAYCLSLIEGRVNNNSIMAEKIITSLERQDNQYLSLIDEVELVTRQMLKWI